jgi:hypothetical protein
MISVRIHNLSNLTLSPHKLTILLLLTTEELQNEAASLQTSITKLTERALATPDKRPNEDGEGNGNAPNAHDSNNAETNTARQQIISVFAACLPVLKARIANLSMAQDLVDSALENASLALRMESLGIAD